MASPSRVFPLTELVNHLPPDLLVALIKGGLKLTLQQEISISFHQLLLTTGLCGAQKCSRACQESRTDTVMQWESCEGWELHSFKKWGKLPDLRKESRLKAYMNMEFVSTCPGWAIRRRDAVFFKLTPMWNKRCCGLGDKRCDLPWNRPYLRTLVSSQ